MLCLEKSTHHRTGDTREHTRFHFQNRDLEPQLPRHRRRLETDIAGTNNDQLLPRNHAWANALDIGEIAQVKYAVQISALGREGRAGANRWR